MRLLVFTDPHGHASIFEMLRKKIFHADAACCVGDFTIFGQDIQRLLGEMDSWGKPVILIHGNHENPEEVRRLCKGLKNVHFIHKSYFVIDDVGFIGYGGDGFSSEDPAAEVHVKAAANLLKEKKLVVLFHQPPFGTKLDLLPFFGHAGNESYTKALLDVQPVFAFSGHLHETFGKKDKIGETKIMNPGPLGVFVRL